MDISNFCTPSLLYMAFSFTHIIIDLFKHMYNTAIVKFFIMILFTILLNTMCQRGLGVISWLIVFITFITMTVITTIVLIVFGLSPSHGNIQTYRNPNKNYKKNKNKNKKCN